MELKSILHILDIACIAYIGNIHIAYIACLMGFIASPVKCIPNVMAIEFLVITAWYLVDKEL